MEFLKKSGRPLAVLLAAAGPGAAAFLYGIDPEKHTVFPCLFRLFTGLDCPGCGMTRAFHALLHLQVLRAVHYNLFSLALAPTLLILWAEGIVYLWRGRFFRLPVRVPAGAVWAAALLLLGYTVARNLPFAPFLSWKV